MSKKSAHSLNKESSKISLTSIIPSTLNSLQKAQRTMGFSKHKSFKELSRNSKLHSTKSENSIWQTSKSGSEERRLATSTSNNVFYKNTGQSVNKLDDNLLKYSAIDDRQTPKMGQQTSINFNEYKPVQSVHYESELLKSKQSSHLNGKQVSKEVILPDFSFGFSENTTSAMIQKIIQNKQPNKIKCVQKIEKDNKESRNKSTLVSNKIK